VAAFKTSARNESGHSGARIDGAMSDIPDGPRADGTDTPGVRAPTAQTSRHPRTVGAESQTSAPTEHTSRHPRVDGADIPAVRAPTSQSPPTSVRRRRRHPRHPRVDGVDIPYPRPPRVHEAAARSPDVDGADIPHIPRHHPPPL